VRKNQDRHKFYEKHLDRTPLQDELAKCQSLLTGEHYELMEEYDKRTSFLQTMGYIEADMKLNLKGKILHRLNNPHDVVIAEAFFEGVF
jgi:superfamily II RNA helicase